LLWVKKTTVLEVKQVAKGSKFYYSSGSFPKQLPNLKCAKRGKTFFKHPDTGWGTPWDLTIYVKTPAYLVIFFGKDFYIIDIDAIDKDIKEGSKYLVEERAEELCIKKDRV